MEEYEWKKRLAEVLRENIFRIPRRNREYEMILQPFIEVSSGNEDKICVKFSMKYDKRRFDCRIYVEKDGAYIHVSGVGSYLDRLFVKGRPEIVCSEFVKWMKLARDGVINGDYSFMFYRERPVGFMVRPSGNRFSYAFFAKDIEECGLKSKKVFELYLPEKYEGNKITCQKAENVYFPMQAYGKGISPINTLDLKTKRTLIWSMLCNYCL